MICEEIFPMGFMSIADQADAAKARAAKLGLPYDSRSIANALASAQAQVAKGLRYDS
jgi:hypothetical protein